jgi:hypothetical protein
VRDVALFFGCLKKFSPMIILQAPLENFQDFERRLARCANDKNAVEPLFVSAIAFRQSKLDILARRRNALLLFVRPTRRPRGTSGWRTRFPDPRVALKRLHPIWFRQISPYFVASRQKSSFIVNRSPRYQLICPRS